MRTRLHCTTYRCIIGAQRSVAAAYVHTCCPCGLTRLFACRHPAVAPLACRGTCEDAVCAPPYSTSTNSLAGLNATCRKNTMLYGQQERDTLSSIAQAVSFKGMTANWSSGGFLGSQRLL